MTSLSRSDDVREISESCFVDVSTQILIPYLKPPCSCPRRLIIFHFKYCLKNDKRPRWEKLEQENLSRVKLNLSGKSAKLGKVDTFELKPSIAWRQSGDAADDRPASRTIQSRCPHDGDYLKSPFQSTTGVADAGVRSKTIKILNSMSCCSDSILSNGFKIWTRFFFHRNDLKHFFLLSGGWGLIFYFNRNLILHRWELQHELFSFSRVLSLEIMLALIKYQNWDNFVK